MASSPFRYPTSINHHQAPPPIYKRATTTTYSMTFSFTSSQVNLHHLFPFRRNSRSTRCHATSPQSEPPPKKRPPSPSGVTATFTRFQDALQIFFAVLLWMFLFFWYSAGHGGNGGRPNKGSRFRK